MDNLSSLSGMKNDCPYVDQDGLKLDETQVEGNFHVMHLNVRSYLKHAADLKNLLEDLLENNVSIDVILLCETFLNSQNICLVDLPGYQIYYKNHEDRPGGGVMIMVKDDLRVYDVLTTPFNGSTESLFVKVLCGKKIYCFGELYRIPNSNLVDFVNDYKSIMSVIDDVKDIVIGSDFNLDLIKSSLHKPTMQFLEDFLLNGFVMTISKPTRVTHSTVTLIDNIICKGSTIFGYDSFVLLEDLSDHYPCIIRFEMLERSQGGDMVLYKRKLNDKVYLKINQALLFHDWSVMANMDVNQSYNYLVGTITGVLDALAPKKSILISKRRCFHEPWMTVKLCKWNSKCKKLFQRFCKTRLQTDHVKYVNY